MKKTNNMAAMMNMDSSYNNTFEEEFFNVTLNASKPEKIYFYNRSDYRNILNNLSPIRYVLEIYVQQYLEIFGLIANLLCILVLCQKNIIHRKSIVYLVYLAVADFMFIFLTKLPNFLIFVGLFKHDIFKTSNLSCFFFDLRTTVFHVYSIILTLTVTIDRFYAIYNPLKSNQFILSRHSKLIGLFLFFISFIVSLPHGYLMVYNPMEKDCDAREIFKKKLHGSDFNYYQIYFTFTEPVIIWFIPGALILCMNSYVIVKIMKSQERRSKLLTNSLNDDVSSAQRTSRIRYEPETVTNDSFVYIKRAVQSTRKQYLCCFQKKKPDRAHSIRLYNLVENSAVDLEHSNENKNKKMNTIPNKKRSVRISLDPVSSYKSNDRQTSRFKHQFESIDYKTSRKMKMSVNQISHYVTIIILGFYFILSTVPYGVLLTFQNNLTLKLNYYLDPDEIYKDRYWVNYGNFRQLVACAKVFFTSNHSLNFFVYLLFNKAFRLSFFTLIYRFKNLFKCN
jgi:hypothetical protein